MTIRELVEKAHATAREKGWWDGDNHNIPEKLALIHSEISEALECYRNKHEALGMRIDEETSKPEGLGVELADAVIRIADFCGMYGIDLQGCINAKMTYNQRRPYRHGGKLA